MSGRVARLDGEQSARHVMLSSTFENRSQYAVREPLAAIALFDLRETRCNLGRLDPVRRNAIRAPRICPAQPSPSRFAMITFMISFVPA